MNHQITGTQNGDETYLTLKGQQANISAPSKAQTSDNNHHDTHLHQNSDTIVYHHGCSLASRGQSRGEVKRLDIHKVQILQ